MVLNLVMHNIWKGLFGMYNCSKKCRVPRCSLEKLPPKFKRDVSSEGHEQSREEGLKLKLLRNSMILQNLSSPAFSWAVLLNIALRFSLSIWLWLFEFSSSLLHSVCLGSFPASFSPLLASCSLASSPAFPRPGSAAEPEKGLGHRRGLRHGTFPALRVGHHTASSGGWRAAVSQPASYLWEGDRRMITVVGFFFLLILHLKMHPPPISLNVQQKDRREAGRKVLKP